MGLFLDGPACTIDDLLAEDSGLLTTAKAADINVTSKLWLAMSEVQSEMQTLLMRFESGVGTFIIPAPRIEQVVMTPDLSRWEKMLAISMLYRDAAFTQLIDRYKEKWDVFAKLTQAARAQLITNGIGLVKDPMPRASLPFLGAESAPDGQAGGTFYACVTWVNAAGQEGSPSDVESIVVPADNVMTVIATGEPQRAVGFNVYVGTVLAMMTLQNTVPVAAGQAFTHIPGASVSTQTAGTGQQPDFVKPLPPKIRRG